MVAGLVDQLHKAVNSDATSIDDIPPFDVGLAHKLHAAVMGPVASGWKGAKNVIVVAHGTLGRLPFHLLVTKPDVAAAGTAGRARGSPNTATCLS